MTQLFAQRQLEFIDNAIARWNLAHGSVRCGKTVCSIFRFLAAICDLPDSQIYIVGKNFDTAHRNVVRLIMESPQLAIFRPFCSWSGKKLYFRDKVITVLGAKDEGAIGQFQGLTMSAVYCDEMTLYPESIIDMIDTRLSCSWSIGFATMNPQQPTHKLKTWIDKARAGDPNYYELKFTLDDNPYVPEDYKERIRNSLSGVFYKRNYLGEWCMAEGAIFDFFDPKLHVIQGRHPPAEYWIAGIDYGTSNAFACILIGVNTGKLDQCGLRIWAEQEYYWDSKKTGRQKTPSEFAKDVYDFLSPYAPRAIYLDPSAIAFGLELQRKGLHLGQTDNDVYNGIHKLTSQMSQGIFTISPKCKNLIREIQTYVWDIKKSERGEDAPIKKDDHALDATRYGLLSHKPSVYDPYKQAEFAAEWRQNRFDIHKNR